MTDEIMIERLSCAYDREMSRLGLGGMYDPAEYQEAAGETLDPEELLKELSKRHTARVLTPDEWTLMQQHMTDDEKAALAYER